MADYCDGSLIFDTELDTTGFTAGSKEMLDAIKDLTKAVDNMGDNMMASFGKAISLLQSVASSASAVNDKMAGTATQAADANERVVESEQRVSHAAEQAAEAVNQQAEATGNFTGAVGNTQRTVSALEKEVNSLSSGLQSVSQSAELGFANGKAVLAFDSKIQSLEQRLTSAREQLAEFGSTSVPTQEYNDLTATITRAEQALFRLYDRRDDMEALGVKENSKQWERLALQIENAESQLARYERERDTLVANGGAFIQGSDTAEYSRMEAALNSAGEVLDRNKSLIDQEALAQARLNVLTAQEAVAAAATTREREAATERLRDAQEVLAQTAGAMSNSPGGGAPTEETISIWSRLASTMKSVGSTALQITGTLAKIPFQAAAKGMQKLTSSVKSFINHAKTAKLQTNALVKALTGLKRMLITRVKRMFISGIFNEVKESLQTLAKFSDAFNQSMSNIKNSAKQLSGNLAVSFGNLVNTFEPMITGLLNALSKLIMYVNAFFAMLGGKTTITVAKKQTDSYRDSLDGAAESAEDLKNQVYGFDELNKRNGKDESGVSDGSDLFEEVPIDSILPDKLRELFEELKELWENGEYFNFGKRIAEALNEVLQTVDDWINNTFRPKGVEWAKIIAEVLNGFVAGLDWNLLGKTLADGLSAVFDIVNTFLTNFDFEALGKGIGEAINGWFDNVEWDLIGQTFANGWNSLIDFIFGIVNQVKWDTIGNSIATEIQNFFNTVDWGKAAQTIVTAVNGIVEAFQHLIDGVNWKEIGQNIGKFLSDSLSGINWNAVGKTIIDAISGLVDLIVGVLDGLNWGEIGTAVGNLLRGAFDEAADWFQRQDWAEFGNALFNGVMDAIEGIDFPALADSFFEFLGSAFGAAVGTIGGFFQGAWEELTKYFEEKVHDAGGSIPKALLQGILDGFNVIDDIEMWLKEHIATPIYEGMLKAFGVEEDSNEMEVIGGALSEGFVNGIVKNIPWLREMHWVKETFGSLIDIIKDLFGIASPSTVMAEIGKFIVEGLLQGIQDTWNAITQFFSTAVSSIKTVLSDAWNAIKSTATTAWEGIKTGITQKFDAAKTTITNTANNIKSALSTTWNAVKSNASSAWENIKGTVSQKFDSLKKGVSTTANGIKSTLSSTWNNIQSSTSSAWGTLKNTVVNLWNGLKSTLQSTDWSSVGSNLVSGIQRGIQSGWSWLTSTVSSLASSLFNTAKSILGIHSPSTVFAEIGKYLDLGLMEGIEKHKRAVVSSVSDLANNVIDEFNADQATLKIGAEGDGLISKLSGITAKLSNIANVFYEINTVLTSMGELCVPAIVSGTEVPYKTRISSDNTNPVSDLSSELDERLSDHTYLLRQILDLLERTKLGIDSDELAGALAFALRSEVRGCGV